MESEGARIVVWSTVVALLVCAGLLFMTGCASAEKKIQRGVYEELDRLIEGQDCASICAYLKKYLEGKIETLQ